MTKEQDYTEQFDPAYAQPAYDPARPTMSGSWRVVLEDESPVGIIWTDYANSAGVVWVTQTAGVEKLNTHFRDYKASGMPANLAYLGATVLDGVELSEERSGPFSEMAKFNAELMNSTTSIEN